LKQFRNVDLLFTDMVHANGMSGGELAKNRAARNPTLKIIHQRYSPEILKQDSLLARESIFYPALRFPSLLKTVRLWSGGGKLPQTKSDPD